MVLCAAKKDGPIFSSDSARDGVMGGIRLRSPWRSSVISRPSLWPCPRSKLHIFTCVSPTLHREGRYGEARTPVQGPVCLRLPCRPKAEAARSRQRWRLCPIGSCGPFLKFLKPSVPLPGNGTAETVRRLLFRRLWRSGEGWLVAPRLQGRLLFFELCVSF